MGRHIIRHHRCCSSESAQRRVRDAQERLSGLRSSAQVDDRRAELASEPAQAPGAGHAGAGHARTDLFHPAVAAWFAGAFRAPSPAQAEAWPAIKARRHTLIAAPTGSGKTLAAFLAAIDDLVRQGLDGALPDADAGRLRLAAQGAQRTTSTATSRRRSKAYRRELARSGFADVAIRTLVADRRHARPTSARACAAAPPHILVTTPESLYVLLGSESGRADAGDDAHGHRRRDPRGRAATSAARISRCRSSACPRSAATASAHRPLGHPEPDRRGGAPPDRRQRERRSGG